MGGVTRRGRRVAAALLAPLVAAVALTAAGLAFPGRAAAFDGFGASEADGVFDEEVSFSVELPDGAPEQLELLLRFADEEVTFVQPVTASGERATFRWDAAAQYISPNTPIHYRWRAVDGGETTLTPERTVLYDDDRADLDWQTIETDEARVHWYDEDRALAQRFAEVTTGAVDRAEALFGSTLGGPVDIFAYRSEADFFGALGPGSREWVGGQTSPDIRTIYVWLQAGGEDYLDVLIIHEVTHMVFADATENPYHLPPRWFNEGLAVWSEREQMGPGERATVQRGADSGRLMAFDAIAEQFPAGADEAGLAYAQGTSLVDMIITEYGRDSIAEILAAYRDGATDDEAMQAGTGRTLDELVDDWFAAFGQSEPMPVEPNPLLPAVEPLPSGDAPGTAEPAPVEPGTDDPGGPRQGAAADVGWLLPVLVGGTLVVLAVIAVTLRAELRGRRSGT